MQNILTVFLSLFIAACGADTVNHDAMARSAAVAESVFINGRIYSHAVSTRTVQAMAIAEGHFIAVGDNDTINALVGPATEIVDLRGAAVFPGLIDAHAHPFQGAEKMLYQCNFPFSAAPDEVAQAIKACAEDPNVPEWIRGGQWSSDFFVNNKIDSPREFLDAVSGGHPVFLEDDSAHHAWVNSRALELAGITADTLDPDGGTFVRDSTGMPNGVLLENAGRIVYEWVEDYTHKQNVATIAKASEIANGFGVTAFGEARTPEAILAAYQEVDNAGLLNVHALLYQQSFFGDSLVLEPVDAFNDRASKYASKNTDAKAIKFFLDGVPTASRSALMLAPYTKDPMHPHDTLGMQMIPTDQLDMAVMAFDKAGYRIKIHTAGDGSVRLALNAVEKARAINGAGHPVSLAHAGYISGEDLPRFKALNVAADFSPYLWYPRPIIDSVLQAVGPRGDFYWPTRDVMASGALITGGSDWPAAAADMNPWPAIEALVTRRNPITNGEASFWPEQAVDLDQALTLWTRDAAFVLGLGDIAGAIEPGLSADFLILPSDPHAIAIESVSEILPTETWFSGRRVWPAQ